VLFFFAGFIRKPNVNTGVQVHGRGSVKVWIVDSGIEGGEGSVNYMLIAVCR